MAFDFRAWLARLIVTGWVVGSLSFGVSAVAQEWRYTVKPGDTLWNISERYLLRPGDWRRVQNHNVINDPQVLRPGSQIRIPTTWLKMKQTSARVIALQGSAQRIDAKGDARPLRVGLLVQQGSEIRTSEGASVTLRFTDRSELLLEANSTLRFDRLEEFNALGVGRTLLWLDRGGAEANVKPEEYEAGSRFRIQTPAATLAVRGTRYRVRHSAQTATFTEVLSGAVSAANPIESVSIPAGFGVRVEPDKRIGRPRQLLAAPSADAFEPLLERRLGHLVVELPQTAQGVRLQVGTDQEFNGLLQDVMSADSRLRGIRLADGAYPARIRYIDRNGLEGVNYAFELLVNVDPEPPLVESPQVDETIRTALPTFTWASSAEAAGYRLQLALSEEFATPLIDEAFIDTNTFAAATELAQGRYFWRVASLAAADDSGPFSDPIPFTVRPAPQIGGAEPEVGADGIVLRWRSGEPGQRYHLQLSADYFFSDLVVDQTLDEPVITLPALRSDIYYLRLRVIDTDGYVGEFSPRQEIVVPLANPWRAVLVPLGLLLLLAL